MLLAFVIVLGLVPVSVFATGTATGDFNSTNALVDATVIMSDLHVGTDKNGTTPKDSASKKSLLQNVLMKIQEDYPNVSTVNSAGDMFSSNESTKLVTGDASMITGWVQSVFGNADTNYVWTDHDRNTTDIDKKSHLVQYENYYVYLLSMGDLASNDRYSAGFNYTSTNSTNRVNAGFTATVEQAIENFKAHTKDLDPTKPLLIVGHQPLFDRRDENAWAQYWVEAINEVGTKMDVVYFFGHNHKYDKAEDYYYAKGSEMPVPKWSDWNWRYNTGVQSTVSMGSTNVKLNFTHICAGYMDPGTKGSTTRTGTALAVGIYENEIKLTVYDSEGVHDGTYAVTETVKRDHVKIPKSLAVTGKTNYEVGDSIQTPTVKVTYTNGREETLTTGCTLTKITKVGAARANQEYTVEGFTFPEAGNYELTYTANVGSYQAQATLEVSVAAEGDAPSNPDTEETPVLDANKVTLGGSTTTTTTKTVYVLATTIARNQAYLLVNGNAAGSGYHAVVNNSGSVGATSVTIKSGDVNGDNKNDIYIELENASNALWTASAAINATTNGTLKNGNYYLYSGSSGLRLDTSSRNWKYNNNKLYYDTRTDRYLTYNGGWTQTTTSSSASQVYFYIPTQGTITETVDTTVEYEMRAEGVTLVYTEANKTGKIDFCLQGNGSDLTTLPAGGSYSFTAPTEKNICTIDNQGNVTFSTLGETTIRVAYTWTQDGQTYEVYRDVMVEAKAPYFGIELHRVELQETSGVTADTFDPNKHYVYNEDTNFYTKAEAYAEGTTYYIAQFTQGDLITAPVALKGIEGGEVFAVWAVVKKYDDEHENGVDQGDLDDDLLTWTVSDTTIATIDEHTGVITFTGKNYGTFRVQVSYTGIDGKTVTDEILISTSKSEYVVPGDGTDDFPDYPKPGAVRFDKTATAVGAFSQTGMAKVELSMTGVPIEKGSDVIIMLDTSSSMTKNEVEGSGGKMRNEVLEAALANLLTLFKTPGANNKPLDIRVAIADFNGYYGHNSTGTTGTPYDRTEGDYVKNGTSNGSGYQQPSQAIVYTNGTMQAGEYVAGSGSLDASAFLPVSELKDSYTLNYTSGTNYDYAFDAIYQLGTAIQAKNAEEGKERDLFVIFMSDGASLQWNYFGTQNGYTKWNDWITGAWDEDDLTTTNLNSTKHSYFYDLIDHDGDGQINEHRMANAIKGDPTKRYEVIRKSTAGLPEGTLVSAGKEYLYTVPGLGAKMFTINFDAKQDGQITEANIDKALASTASDQAGATQYYYKVTSADQLSDAFDSIGEGIRYAATDVKVEDKIGENYVVNFKMPAGLNSGDTAGLEDFFIQVLNYKLDANNERILDQYSVLENFTFDGTTGELKSHTVAGSACGDTCNHVTISGGTITKIEGHYFSFEDKGNGDQFMNWHADRLTRDELVLQYFVYLEGSGGVAPENAIEAGTYYTNEYATLSYTNYNGVEVQNEFPVPQMTWNGAQVRYTFYLVNEKGQPVNRQGYVVPFADAVYVTDIFIDSMTWNDLDQYESFEAALKAKDILPEVYDLYDQGASYDIHVFENEFGSNLNNHFVIGSSFTQEQVDAGEAAWTTYVFNNKSDPDKYKIPGVYAAGDEFWCIGKGTVQKDGDLPSGYDLAGGEVQILVSYDGKLTGFTENEWKELGKNEQYAVILITAADYQIPVDTNNDGKIDGYYLYYKDTDGSWYTIVSKTSDKKVVADFDFGNTAVAFAVVWTPGLKEDTVVVDFGLDVVIDVITNDVMIPGVVGLSATQDDKKLDNHPYDYPDGQPVWSNQPIDLKIGNTVVGKAWIVEGDTAHVRVSLNKSTGMQLNQPITFYYEANVQYYMDNELQNRYMYSKITVIPAATMYYEEDYVTLSTHTITDEVEYVKVESTDDLVPGVTYYFLEDGTYTAVLYLGVVEEDKTYYEQVQKYTKIPGITTESEGGWVTVGTVSNAIQDADRPGFDKITTSYDANNIYGYDSAYKSFAGYSMGSAVKAHVASGKYAKAEFVFYGTGFDIISMTSSTTGTILVSVYDMDGNKVKYAMVDTYYGMNNDGTISLNNPDALYQIPVIKVDSLPHGKYRAEITVSYMSFMDHNQNAAGYDFYLDAIRIYDPVTAGTQVGDETIEDIYNKDQEGWPVYQELRNNVIAQSDFVGDKLDGVVFIDGMDQTASVSDYISYGPNNELYLAKGQAIVFSVDLQEYGDTVKSIHLGMKSADGREVNYVIANTSDISGKEALTNAKTTTLSTATDLYYDITDLQEGAIVIYNAGEGVLSLTNIKATFTQAHNLDALLYVDYNAVKAMLNNLQSAEGALDSKNETQQGDQFKVNHPNKVHSGEDYVVQVVTHDNVTQVNDVTEFTTNSRGERIWNLIFTATTEEAKETRTIVVNGQDGSKKEATIEVDVVEAANMNLKLPVFVNQGETYILTVETSSSVAAIRVGKGEQNTNYTQNVDGTKRTWTVELTAGEEDGKETVTVTAFDENDIASAIAIAQVQVQSFTPSVQVSCKDTVTEGQTLRVTVTTSSDVAAVEVNGVLATTYRTNKRTQQRTWTVELDVKAGKLEVNATAYDKDGRSFTDPEQAKTVTVNENPASTIGKIINDFVNTLRGWFGW